MQIIKQEFNDMLGRGIIPCFEFEIINDEYLKVDIEINDNGILFSFDSDNKRVAFDGIIQIIDDNHYLLPFDEYIDHLDQYLEMINDNIIEGYLIVNDLMRGE